MLAVCVPSLTVRVPPVFCSFAVKVGVALPEKAISARLYAEYYYRGSGADARFDSEFQPPDPARDMRVRAKNATITIAVAEADAAEAPATWQRSSYPEPLQSQIVV